MTSDPAAVAIATAHRVLKGAVVRVLGIATGQTTVNTRTLNATMASLTVKLREQVGPRGYLPWLGAFGCCILA